MRSTLARRTAEVLYSGEIVHLFRAKESGGSDRPRPARSERSDARYGIMFLGQWFAAVAVPASSTDLRVPSIF